MSLINNADYLIHSLRLQYLRNVDDPYGPRLISLSPSYVNNPWVRAAGLTDTERWPELSAPSSPPVSDDEGGAGGSSRAGPTGYLGAAGLKHSATIMGPNRRGSVGMRVSGKRTSTYKPRSIRSNVQDLGLRPGESPPGTAVANGNGSGHAGSRHVPNLAHKTSNLALSAASTAVDQALHTDGASGKATPTTEPPKPTIFIPKFKMAADMEARRRQRMQARAQIRGPEQHQTSRNLDPEMSSSDEEIQRAVPLDSSSSKTTSESESGEEEEEDEDEDYDQVPDAEDDMVSDGDEFDPTFARAEVWDPESMLSSETSLAKPYPMNTIPESDTQLSPVNEGLDDGDRFEIVTVEPSKPGGQVSPLQRRGVEDIRSQSRTADTNASGTGTSNDTIFKRRPVPSMKAQKSALTEMLASTTKSSSENPFTQFYGAMSGRGAAATKTVRVYFPQATDPSGAPMDLVVRSDATMEEVLGFALWTYWEEQWAPPLGDAKVAPDEDPLLSATGWILRIAEEDGEVDEDFPPPDRLGKISKFNFDAYAALPANAAQTQQNRVLEAKIQRRPSRTMATRKKSDAAPSATTLAPPSMTGLPGMGLPESMAGSIMPNFIGSMGPSSSYGAQQLLRIHTANTVDSAHRSTVVTVYSGTYMQEVLELVCKKRKIDNPGDYSLILKKLLVPLDRTVASLQGEMDLELVKKSMLPELGVDTGTRTVRTVDPNASIFKRASEVPDEFGTVDYTSAYKKYNVVRKMPMLGRHERVIAIDGQYVHFLPSASKARAVFENARTMSYHIRSVAAAQQPAKASATFKLIVQRNGGAKRYEFEAENPRLAAEIVATIKNLKADLERKGPAKGSSRRSRQVV